MTNQCEHGQLARVCLLCEKDETIRVLREALEKIASWSEGPVVTGAFDEPAAAMIARAALEASHDR